MTTYKTFSQLKTLDCFATTKNYWSILVKAVYYQKCKLSKFTASCTCD